MGGQEVKFSTVKAYALENGIERAVQKFGEEYRNRLNTELASSLSGAQGDNVDEYVPSNKEKGFMDQLWPGKPWAERTPLGKAARWVMTAGISPILALGGLTGCTKDSMFGLGPNDKILYEGKKEPVDNGDKKPASPTIYTIVNINVNVSVVNTGMDKDDFLAIFNAAMQQIIDQIGKLNKDVISEMGNITNTLIAYFNSIGLGSLSAIKELLEKISGDNDYVKGILDEINKKLDKIVEQCNEMINQGMTISAILTELENQGIALIDIINALRECNESLENIVQALIDNGKSLDLIIGLLKNNGYSLAEIKELLIKSNKNEAEIINAINTLIQGQEGLTDELRTAVKTFASFMEKGLALDAETQKVVYAIFDLITKLGDNNGGASVDTTNIEKMLAELLNLVANLPTKEDVEGNKAILDGIYGLIERFMAQEKAMDQNVYDLLVKFMNQEENMNKDIYALVEKFMKQEKAADDELLKLGDTVLATVAAMNAKLDQLPEKITEPLLAKLNEILNKIPKGCEGCDVTVLISRLDTIIEKLGKDDPSNEGIVDDLDDLLK